MCQALYQLLTLQLKFWEPLSALLRDSLWSWSLHTYFLICASIKHSFTSDLYIITTDHIWATPILFLLSVLHEWSETTKRSLFTLVGMTKMKTENKCWKQCKEIADFMYCWVLFGFYFCVCFFKWWSHIGKYFSSYSKC